MRAARFSLLPTPSLWGLIACTAALCVVIATLPGCGSKPPLTPQEFLQAEQAYLGQVDVSSYEEVDFGRIKATHVDPQTRYSTVVQFHLWAVVRPGKGKSTLAAFEANQQRLRDRVIAVIQNAELDQLTEPSLQSLKYDLLPVVRETLRTSDLRDIIFDDFQLNTT